MYADGDPIGELPLRLRSVPAALQLLVPASAAGSALGSTQAAPQPRPGSGPPSVAAAPKQPPAD
jgi:hypothetical protein